MNREVMNNGKHISCKRLHLYFAFLFVLLSHVALSQAEKKYIHHGNKLYSDGKYSEAGESYGKALDMNRESFMAEFNHADALFKQEKYEEATQKFLSLAEKAPDKLARAGAYHNLGNSLLMSQKIKESIDAYKNALRNNPQDDETRHNLAYAMKMQQQQQQDQQQNQKQEDKEQQEKKNQEENQDKQKDKEQEKNKDQKSGQEKSGEKKEQQPDKMSREDAQRMLDAMNNEEKRTQQKLKNQKKAEGVKVPIEKDW